VLEPLQIGMLAYQLDMCGDESDWTPLAPLPASVVGATLRGVGGAKRGNRGSNIAYLVVNVVCPGATEEVGQRAVVRRVLVFGQDVVGDDAGVT
jgi:hypothetical protein